MAEKNEPTQAAKSGSKPLTARNVVQIGLIVRDVEKSAKAWADLLGMEVPKWHLSDPPEKAHNIYRGRPTKARLKLAIFQMDNIQLELMEPVGGPSEWMKFLETKGEGIHHIAFGVKGIEEHIANMESKGIPLIQKGQWTDHGGGAYAYFDIPQLGTILELLENY